MLGIATHYGDLAGVIASVHPDAMSPGFEEAINQLSIVYQDLGTKLEDPRWANWVKKLASGSETEEEFMQKLHNYGLAVGYEEAHQAAIAELKKLIP